MREPITRVARSHAQRCLHIFYRVGGGGPTTLNYDRGVGVVFGGLSPNRSRCLFDDYDTRSGLLLLLHAVEIEEMVHLYFEQVVWRPGGEG